MKVFLSKIRAWGWAVIAVLAAVAALLVRGLFTKGQVVDDDALLPAPPTKIMKKKIEAEERAMVTRAEVKVKTEAEKKKLTQLTNIADGSQRRRELAKFLDEL